MTVEISPTFHPLRGKHNNIGKRIRISIGVTQQIEEILLEYFHHYFNYLI